MAEWYLPLAAAATPAALAPLAAAGAETAVVDGRRWLRLEPSDESLESQLRMVAEEVWEARGDGRLSRPGERVARRRIDPAGWRPLADVLAWELPVPALGGVVEAADRVPLELVRGGAPAEPAAMRLPAERLARWTAAAAEVRLQRLRWVRRGGEALVLGAPLPPLAGTTLVDHGRVLVPAGWNWRPAVEVPAVRQAFGVADNEWLVWESPDRWSRIDGQAWVTLRRSLDGR